jgi:RNA polymerase sigma factor (sigma-70 family)
MPLTAPKTRTRVRLCQYDHLMSGATRHHVIPAHRGRIEGESVEDSQLAAAFRTGEPAAVRAVYDRYAGAVFTIAISLLRDRELAADAVQVTFLNAWRASKTVDASRPIAPWLYTIARRAAIDIHRARSRAPEPAEPNPEDAVTLPPSFERAWEAWEIRGAIDALPQDEREIVRLQHFLELTHSEIAERLEIPLGTVKSRSYRAHRRLASLLGHLVEVAP